MAAGYSRRSLVKKLGIKPDSSVAIIAAPPGYDQTLGPLPGNRVASSKLSRDLDFIHAFFADATTLDRQFPALKKALRHNGALWISWPKKAARMTTDIDENVVRAVGLKHGLVDIKVCAIERGVVWTEIRLSKRSENMKRIVECVPNFSEGRRPEVVDAIAAAILSTADIYVLDRQMDPDHNRSVITFAGSPEAIGEAAFRGVEAAARLIDLQKHQGAHPRIGAADVVPFVPIRGVSIEECIAIARQVGARIALELKIPVYLYEAAATRPDRVNLENIRRGQYEGLREQIGKDSGRLPDFGEARIHSSAGATVVGARKPLIAYNINLNTPDLAIARQIAKRIRFSSGGFPYVKGMGVMLKTRNLAQVSMNLTDYEQTPVGVVFEAVKREAEQLGVTVAGSEIVGLIPQRAIEQTAEFFLRVENFKSSMVLENRLDEAMLDTTGNDVRLRDFIEQVASARMPRGGDAVSALSGTLGVALGQMCIRNSQGENGEQGDTSEDRSEDRRSEDKTEKDAQEYVERLAGALAELEQCRSQLFELTGADDESLPARLEAYKISKESKNKEPAAPPLMLQDLEIYARTTQCALNAFLILRDLRPILHPATAADLAVALHVLASTVRGGIAKLRRVLKDLNDSQRQIDYGAEIVAWETQLSDITEMKK